MRKTRACVIGSYCCCNKLPQPWWLQTAQTYYLTVLKFGSLEWDSTGLKSRCWHSCFPFWRLWGKICFLAFSCFERLPTFIPSGIRPSIFTSQWNCISVWLISVAQISLCFSFWPSSSTSKDPCGYTSPPESSRIISLFKANGLVILIPSVSLYSPLPSRVTYLY